MYCDSEIKSTVKIAIQEIDPHKYLSLTRGYVDEDYLKHTNYQIVPPMI
jgi:chromosome condensin MukBEF MukE localization factor